MKSLFSLESTRSALSKTKNIIQSMATTDEFQTKRNNHICSIIEFIIANPKEWDEKCQINIEWIGDNFIRRASLEDNPTSEALDGLFACCLRFVLELNLTFSGELALDLRSAVAFSKDNIDLFTDSARAQIEYAQKDMPISILKVLLNSKAFNSIKNLKEAQDEAEKKMQEWAVELRKKEQTVSQLKENLDQYEQAFNFVGLHHGFDALHKIKSTERRNTLILLVVFGFLIPIPLIVEMASLIASMDDLKAAREILTLTIIPSISISALFVYFFRIILSNYKSTKSLILQLELRKTLCAFIQSYSTYSSEIKSKDKEALNRFENIIFSGLVPDESNIPSTFDGIDQLSALIKSIKS